MTLREQFENEIRDNNVGISVLFKTSNQHYIEWLESKINTQFVCLCPRTTEDNCDRKEPCKECKDCLHLDK